VSGFWHGANWTFIVWGGIHALFFLPLLIMKRNRKNLDQVAVNRLIPTFREFLQILLTFSLTTFAWIFFRSPNIQSSYEYILRILKLDSFKIEYLSIERYNVEMLLLISLLVLFEWFNRNKENPISGKYEFSKTFILLLLIISLGVYSEHSTFIYFQF